MVQDFHSFYHWHAIEDVLAFLGIVVVPFGLVIAGLLYFFSREKRLLREDSIRFHSLFNSFSLGVFQTDPAGSFVWVNPTFCSLIGYSEEELLGCDLLSLGSPEDRNDTRLQLRALFSGESHSFVLENRLYRKDGTPLWFRLSFSLVRGRHNETLRSVAIAEDISDRIAFLERSRLETIRNRALVELNQLTQCDMQKLLDTALDRVVEITGSRIGYIYFYCEETAQFTLYSWSKSVMAECKVMNPQTLYALEKTGLWGEAVRQRRPIVTNDYAAPNPHKKGIPDGHVAMTRHMNLPIVVDEKIVAVVGVANKTIDYTDDDITSVTLFMDGVWKIVRRQEMLEEIRTLNEDLEKRVAERTGELRESEARMRPLFEYSDDGMCFLESGLIVEVNDAFARLLGRDDRTSLYGKPLSDWSASSCGTAGEIVDKLTEYERVARLYELCHFKWTFTNATGGLVPVDVQFAALTTPHGPLLHVVVRDTTQLQWAEDNVRLFFDVTLDLLGIANFEGYFTMISPSWSRTLGWTDEELMARPFLELVHPDDQASTIEAMEVLAEGKSVSDYVNRYRCKDGTIRWLSWNSRGVVERGLIIAAAHDVTDVKLAEIELKNSREAALAASRAKSEFLAGISHEFRTPLNAIIGFTALLDKEIREERYRSYLEAISTSGRSLLRLINDILDLSRVEAGRMPVVPVPVQIITLLNEIYGIFVLPANAKGLALSIRVDPFLQGVVVIDEVRLRQILLNLVGNAVKFTETGSVVIAASCVKKCGDEGEITLCIEVTDTGIGIPLQEQEDIFEPFRQAKGQDYRRYGGTGLGLGISRKLAENMGGTLTVVSLPGKGSTFRFVIDTIRRSPPVENQNVAPAQSHTLLRFSNGTVLVIEDIQINRDLMRALIEASGLTVLTADSGEEGIARFREHRPDLVFLDIAMSGMDGFETARRIRALPGGDGVPMYAVSATVLTFDDENAQSAGMSGYLPKPISFESLATVLSRYFTPADMADTFPPSQDGLQGLSAPTQTHIREFLSPVIRRLEGAIKMSDVHVLADELERLGLMEEHRAARVLGIRLREMATRFDLDGIASILQILNQE